ncbi:hypothetical protein HUJ05_000862 [Dendroctonus ponderosae]|nr:hypothetical protein HUJ05_000862 [Dendroctonus ponderosae]
MYAGNLLHDQNIILQNYFQLIQHNINFFLIQEYLYFIGIHSLRDVQVTIPAVARVKDTIILQCNYDLENQLLYTVKWYKAGKEFYRFIPRELPHSKVFPMTGVHVDKERFFLKVPSTFQLNKSTSREVVLRNVQVEVSGTYTCEVSSDAPDFDTKMDSAHIFVVDYPFEDPLLAIDKNLVDIGDYIKANCSTFPSYPAANISWYLNGMKVRHNFLERFESNPEFAPSKRNYYSTSSGVELIVTDDTFRDGKAILSCVATLFKIYRGERKHTFEEGHAKPRPSSVLSPLDVRSGSRRLGICQIGYALPLLLVHVHR